MVVHVGEQGLTSMVEVVGAGVDCHAWGLLRPFPAGWGDRYSDHDSGSRDRYSSRSNVKPGDWDCPSCQFSNFASRTACFKCRTPKGETHFAMFCSTTLCCCTSLYTLTLLLLLFCFP